MIMSSTETVTSVSSSFWYSIPVVVDVYSVEIPGGEYYGDDTTGEKIGDILWSGWVEVS
mgnify:CR=1 FL=1